MGSKQIRVLHVYKTSLPQTIGGIEIFIDALCRKTADLLVDNTVFSLTKYPSPQQPFVFNGYQIIQAKENIHLASTGFSLSAVSILPRLADQADLIHYHFPNPFADFLHFFCKVKKPFVVTYHSDIIRQKWLMPLYRFLMNRFLASAKCLVATSPQYFATSPVLQRFQRKSRIIPIGLDKTHYPKPSSELLKYWEKNLPTRFFLFIGALRYYKGLHLLLRALKGTNFHLVVAGTGDMEQSLKNQAHSLGLSRVSFLGKVSDQDKAALLYLCRAFVFPSFLRSEAFGISLLEAAMYGKPAISAEISTGTSFVNVHGETGLVVPPGNVQALREAMDKLYHDEALAAFFGENAAQRFHNLFTAEKQAIAYARLYREVLA